jgi:outer membrane protein OmpA-like peptidoglycan-associated protein
VRELASRAGRWLALGLWLAAACGAPARPPAMARMSEVHAAPATTEAEAWAPQAHAHAVELEAQAESALRGGDTEAAALIAERAIAAHQHAWALMRLARAERRRLEAEKELAEQRRVLSELRAQHQRLTAEAAALELRVQVARSALPVPPHETSPGERREARRRAAAALSAQARLLCVGARLLGEDPRVAPVLARLDELDQKLTAGAEAKSIETATELRSACLDIISEIRHQNSKPAARSSRAAPATALASSEAPAASAAVRASAAPLPADALLEELSAAGAAPSRDDRGVSVSLRNLFGPDGKLTERARPELERLVRVAEAHPEFPVLLVGHSSSERGTSEVGRQLELLRTALADSGVAKLAVASVGDRQPLLPPRLPSARARNQRIELVFVAPGF